MTLLVMYSFVSAIILERGVGIERLMIFSNSSFDVFYYLKNFFITVFVSVLSYFFLNLPHRFLNLLPLFLIVLFLILELFVQKFFTRKSLAQKEKNFVYGITLLSIFESYSLFSLIVFLFVGFLSMMLFDVLLKSIHKTICERSTNYYLRLAPLSLISLGIIVTVFSFF